MGPLGEIIKEAGNGVKEEEDYRLVGEIFVKDK